MVMRKYIPVAEPYLNGNELKYVTDCIESGWVSSAGSYVDRFEREFADFCGTEFAISTNSGTAALHLALLALGIGPGDEVIIPALTFIATANAVNYVGAKPVIVDVDPVTWTIDVTKIEQAITGRTVAIIPVHLYGCPAHMATIKRIADYFDLFVVEDAAEAHGAQHTGRFVGGIGDIGIFSFYGNKIITTGEGGMIVTNDALFADSMRLMRSHGQSPERRYFHSVVGYNYRMTNLQAALGMAQLEQIDEIIGRKRAIADRYRQALKQIRGLLLPTRYEFGKNVYWLYSIVLDPDVYGHSARALATYLSVKGVGSRPFFVPIHKQPMYQSDIELPVSEYLSENGLSLPSSPNLTDDEVDYICSLIKEFPSV